MEDTLRLVMLDYVAGDGLPPATPGQPGDRAFHEVPRADGRVRHDSGPAVARVRRERRADAALAQLHDLSHEELLEGAVVAAILGVPAGPGVLDFPLEARGFRLLHRLPRVSDAIIERIVERFVTLPHLMNASLADLEKVGGVGEARARSVKHGLSRMVEASILERYE